MHKDDRLATPTFFGPCGFREDFLRLPFDRSELRVRYSRFQDLQAYHGGPCGDDVIMRTLRRRLCEHLKSLNNICRLKIAAP